MTDSSSIKNEPGSSSSGTSKPKVEKILNNAGDQNRMNPSAQHNAITITQGYNYAGTKEDIGVILALQNEKFANKVAFTMFIDKLKNYVLTNFEEARDMMPILRACKIPKRLSKQTNLQNCLRKKLSPKSNVG